MSEENKNRLSRLSFSKRLTVGFGLMLAVSIIVLSVIAFRLNNARGDLLEIVDDRYQKVSYTNDIQKNFLGMQRSLSLAEVEGSADEIDKTLDEINQYHIIIEDRYAKLQSMANTQNGEELLAEFKALYDIYTQNESQVLTEMASGSPDNFDELMVSLNESATDLLPVITEFISFQEELMNDALLRSEERYNEIEAIVRTAILLSLLLACVIAYWVIRSTTRELNEITDVISNVDLKDTTTMPRLKVRAEDEIGRIAIAFNNMSASLEKYSRNEKEYNKRITDQNWIQTCLAEVAEMNQGIFQVNELADRLVSKLTPMLGASIGAIYLKRKENDESFFFRAASYGDGGREHFKIGEGIIGQTAVDQKVVRMEYIPDDYQLIKTGLGEVRPKAILIAPIIYEKDTIAVLEFASMREFNELEYQALTQMIEMLGMAIHSVQSRMEIERLLSDSQAMTEELQVQAEELQSQSEELQMQSEELRMINEQLEERSQEAEQKSKELEFSKEELEAKNEQLLQSSKYKSEFLANMSHELRTPLNSILILSEMLAEKANGDYTEEEREFAKVIYTSGNDLMMLINDILDLSKVEAGKLEVFFNETNIREIAETVERSFMPMAEQKGLTFNVEIEEDLPSIFYTDEQRMQQIIKNLLSNAVKFTNKGSVSLKLEKVKNTKEKEALDQNVQSDFWMKIVVEDTGLGIPSEKQDLIFEAFQQADGATARKYGGTGLGLSICREFAKLLGGFITLDSKENEGSVFTVYLPNLPEGLQKTQTNDVIHLPISNEVLEQVAVQKEENEEIAVAMAEPEPDELIDVFKGKRVLITDDDHRNIFALKNALESKGVEIMVAENGIECLNLLQREQDLDMILMDIMMPELDGYETMRHIRSNPDFISIPIIALTAKAMKGDREKCLEAGATDYISKPINLEQLFSVMRVWLTK
ncbi:hybrid sensor histidine kinase/response regulator [Pradoshia eiseniae]|uniref:Circadian input-output histidine kinase CikA n=1 Tax=Pradoshia eiseniae TaxID=2064768 RepID=A0A2S7MYB4_9BACI|nr:response regulator [Pradoshia eiseniae]PQD94760.1 hybrid sensor histidine kinase/response regulator [Pradoshia eiseniae]